MEQDDVRFMKDITFMDPKISAPSPKYQGTLVSIRGTHFEKEVSQLLLSLKDSLMQLRQGDILASTYF